MVRKGLIANIANIAVFLLDILSFYLISSTKWPVLAIGGFVIGVAVFVRAYHPATLKSLVTVFDFNVMLTVCLFLYSQLNEHDFMWTIPSVAGCMLLLIFIMLLRSNLADVKGKAFGIVMLILIILLTALLAGSVATPAGNILVGLASIVGIGLDKIGDLINRFVLYLISILPNADVRAGENQKLEKFELPLSDDPEGVGANKIVTIIAIIVVAVTILYCLVLLIKKFIANKRVAKLETEKLNAVRKKSRLGIALEALRKQIVYEFKMLCYMTKSEPLAKYYRMVNSKRFTIHHKKKSETPREYITRLGGEEDFINSVEQKLYKL